MKPNKMQLAGTKIGIFGKGGSGKSTFVVLLAAALQKHGYSVCVLDADSTNIGIVQALGIDEAPESLLKYYGGMAFRGGKVTCPVDDPTPLDNAQLDLATLPRRYWTENQAGIALMIAGKLGEQGPGAGCDGPLAKLARDIRIMNSSGLHPVTILDFKAGLEDSARGVITGLDWAVVVVDPTSAGVEMAIHFKDILEQMRAGSPPATDHLNRPELVEAVKKLYREAEIKGPLIVLNKIPDETTEEYLRKRLGAKAIDPVGVIPENKSIAASWLKAESINADGLEKVCEQIIGKLEDSKTQALNS